MSYDTSGKSDVSTAFSLMVDMLSQYWWVYLAFIVGMIIFTPLSLAIVQRVDRYANTVDVFVPAIVLTIIVGMFSLITTNEFVNWWSSQATACYNDTSAPLSSCPEYGVISQLWTIDVILLQLVPLVLLGGALLRYEQRRRENNLYAKTLRRRSTPEMETPVSS